MIDPECDEGLRRYRKLLSQADEKEQIAVLVVLLRLVVVEPDLARPGRMVRH
jgi:hypothetical protein